MAWVAASSGLGASRPGRLCRLTWRPLSRCDLHEHVLCGVVAVAMAVPLGLAGLGMACEVGGPGADGVPAGLGEAGV